jgi:hypothetical protein
MDKAIKILKTKVVDAQPDMRVKIITDDPGMTLLEFFELISN